MSNMTPEEKRDYKSAIRQANQIERMESYNAVPDHGLCTSCIHFSYRELEHGHRSVSFCTFSSSDNWRRLSNTMRITKCNDYDKKGQMSIEGMWMIAKHIDIATKKVIGFKDFDEYELFQVGDIDE